jgi:signal transduction histidine kinase
LISNALNALDRVPEQERMVELSITEADDRRFASLKVGDTGPGLSADELPRVFEPFFSTRPGGLGLGLSLCETLAASMGGRLAVGNQPARGAVFTLWLPQHR